MIQTPSILYLPASGPAGSGEYIRCLMLARAVARRWPQARARFMVNRHAAYARTVPFPAVLLESSPTHATAEVSALIRAERPDIVIFDNAGRVAQFAAAKASGATTIFISSRINARRKGTRLGRLRHMDQHWVAQPEWATPPATLWERMKKRLWFPVETLYLDATFEESTPEERAALRTDLGLADTPYVVLCAGGGGNFGRGPRAPDVLLEAAAQIAETGVVCVVVLGSNYDKTPPQLPGVVTLDKLPNAQLMALLREARLVVTSGGDILIQALAQRCICIAFAVAGDQPDRLERCVKRGLIEPVALQATEIIAVASRLLADEARRVQIARRIEALNIRNGLSVAVQALEHALAGRHFHDSGVSS